MSGSWENEKCRGNSSRKKAPVILAWMPFLSILQSRQLSKVTVDLQGPILSKFFLQQIQDFYFIWIFQKQVIFKA